MATRELPAERSASTELAHTIEDLAEEKVLSPIENFLNRHSTAAGVVTIGGIGCAVGATIYNASPKFLLSGALAVGCSVLVLGALSRVPAVTRWLERLARQRRSQKVLEIRRSLERKGSQPVNLNLPDERTVNLGNPGQQHRNHTSSANEISSTAAEAAAAFQNCSINEMSHDFSSKMGITTVYVTAGQSGQVQRFDTFCQEWDRDHPGSPSMLEDWYPERRIPSSSEKVLDGLEARVSFQTQPGQQSFPLPAGCTVETIRFFDREGHQLNLPEGVYIREGILGSLLVNIPPGVTSVEYDVYTGAQIIEPHKIARLQEAIPKHPCFVPDQERLLRENLERFVEDPSRRARLDYAAMTESGLTYSMDPLVIAMQKRAGRALSESLLGMGMGICDSFAYTCARRFNNLDLPALSVAGLVIEAAPNGEKTYDQKEAHAQTVLPTREGPQIFDPTIHAAPDTIDSGRLTWYERAKALLSVSSGTYRDAFEVSSHIGARLRGEVSAEPIDSHWWDPLYRAWHAGLVPRPREKAKHSNPGHSLQEDHHLEQEEQILARALLIKSYDDGLKDAVARGLQKRNLEPVFQYLSRPLKAKLESDEVEDLPEELQEYAEYNPISVAVQYTNTALLENRLNLAGRERAFEWLFSQFGSPYQFAMAADPNFQAKEEAPIPFSEASVYGDPRFLRLMSPDEKLNYFQALLGSAVRNMSVQTNGNTLEHLVAGFGSSTIRRLVENDPKPYTQFCTALRNVTVAKNFPIGDLHPVFISRSLEAIGTIAEPVSKLLGSFSLGQDKELTSEIHYQRRCLVESIASILNAQGHWGPALFAIYDSDHDSGGLKGVLSSQEGEPSFPDLLRSPARGKTATEYFADVIVQKKLSFIDPRCSYSYLLGKAQELGFDDLSFQSHQPEIEAAMVRCAKKVPLRERINLPSDSTPLSTLIHEVCDTPGRAVTHIAEALERQGAINRISLQEQWPKVAEDKLAARAAELFTVRDDFSLTGNEQNRLSSIPLFDYAEYVDLFTTDGSRQSNCARYLTQVGRLSRESQKAIVQALKYPEFAEHIRSLQRNSKLQDTVRSNISLAIAAPLGDDRSYYHANLWASGWEGRILTKDGSVERVVEEFLERCDSGEFESGREAPLVDELISKADARFDGLPSISPEQKVRALLHRYLQYHQHQRMNTFAEAQVPDALSALSDIHEIVGPGDITNNVWNHLEESLEEPFPISVDACCQEASERLLDSRHFRNLKAPYQRFLQNETGKVFAKGTSGDVAQLRNYQTGDDLRLLAHKASARSGRPLIKVLEAQESRNFHLVYDAALIHEHDPKNPEGSSHDAFANPAITDIFMHLQLAEAEGVDVDLWIPTRGGYWHFESLLRPEHDGDPPRYRSAQFRKELTEALGEFIRFFAAERDWLGQPIYDQNILRNIGNELRGDRVIVCRMHPENEKKTMPAINLLQKKGGRVAFVRNDVDL